MVTDRKAMRDALLMEIGDEYERAIKKFPTFTTRHEGYAVILEELDEVWTAIKDDELITVVERELVQVGAMVLRFLMDLVYHSSEQRVIQDEKK